MKKIMVLIILSLLFFSLSVVKGNTNTLDQIKTDARNEVMRSYLPTVYVIGSGVDSGDITYGGGMKWLLGRYGGIGLEYRQFRPRVNFAQRRYRMKGNSVGGFVYFVTPQWKTLSLGLDLGGGVLWDRTGGLDISETFVASGRINISKAVTQYFDITIWGGGNHIGSFTVSDSRVSGRSRSQEIYEGGVAIQIHLGRMSHNIQNYFSDR